jgi:hypothetical protein
LKNFPRTGKAMTQQIKFILHAAIIIQCSVSSLLFAQRKAKEVTSVSQLRLKGHEVFEGKFITIPKAQQRTSPAFRFSSDRFFTTQVNVSAGANIVGDAANEPSIAVDPTNPNRMAIGWRQFNTVANNFRQAGYGYTTDGGQTWTFPGVLEPGIFRSDPVLASDADGNIYYNSLTTKRSNFSCDVYKSTDGGAVWDTGTYAYGGDKQWMAIDQGGSIGKGNVYAYWTPGPSICATGSFTRSTDDGDSYEDCTVIPRSPFWGTLAVSLDGTLYFGASGDTSFLIGKSTTTRDSTLPVSWDTVTAVSLDGNITYGADPNPGGIVGQTWVAVDNSMGPTSGNVYLLCSVQRHSTSDPLDVMFARSTDGGLTWSPPIRVNDDTNSTAWQWFGTMSVAPNGRIDVVWLDTRDNPGTVLSSLYYSFSVDGGISWSTNERFSGSFDPHVGWPQQNKMGDYFHMISDNAGANLAWAATFNGEQDVYYGRINESSAAGMKTILVEGSWNILSVPVFVGNYAKTALFPDAISNAFWYQGSGYSLEDTLAIGTGYWIKFATPESVAFSGTPIVSETVAVNTGWNLIGTISSVIPTSGITSSPAGIVTSEFFGYSGHYVTSQTLQPGKGYWVLTDQPGELILSSSPAINSSTKIHIVPTSELPPSIPDDRLRAPMTPSAFALEQNYPDPFNPATVIRFQLPVSSFVTIKIYDTLGQEVAILVNRQKMNGGNQRVDFNAGNLPSGVYFYHLRAVGISDGDEGQIFTAVKKMVLLK